jgi:hypothetical protein
MLTHIPYSPCILALLEIFVTNFSIPFGKITFFRFSQRTDMETRRHSEKNESFTHRILLDLVVLRNPKYPKIPDVKNGGEISRPEYISRVKWEIAISQE